MPINECNLITLSNFLERLL